MAAHHCDSNAEVPELDGSARMLLCDEQEAPREYGAPEGGRRKAALKAAAGLTAAAVLVAVAVIALRPAAAVAQPEPLGQTPAAHAVELFSGSASDVQCLHCPGSRCDCTWTLQPMACERTPSTVITCCHDCCCGYGDQYQSLGGYSHVYHSGGAQLLQRFDCQAGLWNYKHGWSTQKLDWCCSHEGLGCQGSWLKRNWVWVTVACVVLLAVGLVCFAYYRKTQKIKDMAAAAAAADKKAAEEAKKAEKPPASRSCLPCVGQE